MLEDDCSVEWRDVVGFPGYQVSDQGRVRSRHKLGRGGGLGSVWRLLKIRVNKQNRRHQVMLCRDGKKFYPYVAKLVLEAFVGPCPEGQEVRHLNDIRTDDRRENLAWGTRLQNMADRKRNYALRP